MQHYLDDAKENNMKTDLIADIKWYYKRAIDRPLSWMEAIGSKMSSLRLEKAME